MRSSCLQLFRFAFVALSVILAACGGGGGSGDGGTGGSTDGLSLSTNVLTFTAPNTNSTPQSQIIIATVTGVTSGTLYIKIVSTGPAVASITNISVTGSTTGQATINPAPAGILGPGVHTSTITVYACTTDPNCSSGQLSGSPQTVNVTYKVNGITTSVSSLQYSVGNIPVAGDSNRQITLVAYPYQDWSAATNVPWLGVLPATGNASGTSQMAASLVQAEVDGMSNGTYSGSLTLTMSSGTVITIPVTLTIARTQVNYVAPYVATANTSGEVIIRGENFSQVRILDVTFGGVSATTFDVVSNSEIHAAHPPLSAGTYPVKLQNDLAIDRSLANLVVVMPRSYGAGTLQYPQTPHQPLALEYDAEREALLVAVSYFDGNNFNTTSRQGNRILRYQFVNGTINSISMKEIPLLQDLTLSPDGRQVIAITDNAVIHLDPVTLTELRRTNASLFSSYYLKDIVVTNDGNALITSGLSGSGGTPTYLYPLSQSLFQNTFQPCNYFATPAVSANGSLAVLVQGGLSPVPPLCAYDSSSGSFATLPINANQTQCMNSAMGTCRPPALDRSANRIAVVNNLYAVSIYNRNFTALGQLPGMYGVVAFSPNGARTYAYESNGILRTFDMTASTVNGQFPEIGSGTTLAGNPGSAIVTYPPSPYDVVKITVTPDGGTLFIAGSNQLVIQPAP